MQYEEEIFSGRFDLPKVDIERAINYFCAVHLFEVSNELLSTPEHVPELGATVKWHGVYNGIELELTFPKDGDKRHWQGATFVGEGPFRRREHYVGYIELNQIKISSEIPMEVRIVCGWKPFASFFHEMARYLENIFETPSQLYLKGLEQGSPILRKMLANQETMLANEGEILRLLDAIRRWAKATQKTGLTDPDLQEALERLAEQRTSVTKYLELNVPIVPKILTYKVKIGAENIARLKAIIDKLLQNLDSNLD